ncbi:undecaprenyl/decaprenyl-phosphate alpha-N-acetylglucosaminyl 1-phosphate transferase [Nitrospinaceae bacterium]|nr:undecaprenyl/decaprenyl-phosphate alpha-N-acetylglucosaminyl 1-phosphate transferase [Nitrospinaceae bacterium]
MIIKSPQIPGLMYFLGCAVSLVAAFALTLTLIQIFSKLSILARPLNKLMIAMGKPVIPFGGIPVILSFLFVLWFFYFSGWINQENLHLFQKITLGVCMMTALGIYDDIYHCSPRIKFLWQIIIAIILFLAGFQIDRIGDVIDLGSFSILLTVFWIVGITNSINLVDGIDGLASGLILLSCVTLSFIYLERNMVEASFLAVILTGSIFGFLIFNFPPAKIILGDTGSLPLGLLISLITLLPLSQKHTDEIYYLIPIITLLIPILDTTFSFFRRLLKGTSPFSKDSEHFHHRLAKLGFSQLKTITILFFICFYFNLTALLPAHTINLIPNLIPIYFLFIIGNIVVFLYLLNRLEKKKQEKYHGNLFE